jgi:hypothetical protein
MEDMEDVSLFDDKLLKEVDFTQCSSTYNPPISPTDPGEDLLMRSLRLSDYDKGLYHH